MTQIKSTRVTALDLPLKEPFEIALGMQNNAKNVLVAVETDSGTVGYGEGAPIPSITGETQGATIATAKSMCSLITGAAIEEYRSISNTITAAFAGMPAARLAVETAIVDAYCRERDIPLSELVGNPPSPITTDLTIPIVPPDAGKVRAEKAVQKGYSELKIKTGTDIESDVERVVAVSDAAPEAELKVDANQGWTPTEAIRFVDNLESHGVQLQLLEQPVGRYDIDGIKYVRERVNVPVAADESVMIPEDALSVLRRGAADVINLKLNKSGLLGAMDIISIGRASGTELMIGCMLESAIGIHTGAHLAAGSNSFTYRDLDGNRLLAEDIITDEGPTIDISGPGHGITPDENFIK